MPALQATCQRKRGFGHSWREITGHGVASVERLNAEPLQPRAVAGLDVGINEQAIRSVIMPGVDLLLVIASE